MRPTLQTQLKEKECEREKFVPLTSFERFITVYLPWIWKVQRWIEGRFSK